MTKPKYTVIWPKLKNGYGQDIKFIEFFIRGPHNYFRVKMKTGTCLTWDEYINMFYY